MAKVICFFNSKGGVGTTVLSVNLAVVLSLNGYKTLLLDASIPISGDMSRLLGLFPSKSFIQYLHFIKDLDVGKDRMIKFFSEYILTHNSGVHTIQMALSSGELSDIEREVMTKAFDVLFPEYDFVIVDGGHNFHPFLVTLWDYTNLILEVVVPDILSVYQAKESFNIIQGLYFPKDMVKLVINRFESKGGVGLKEIRTLLPLDIVAKLPSDGRVVGESVNFGVPVVAHEPNAKISQAFRSFADVLLSNEKLYVEKIGLDNVKEKLKAKIEQPSVLSFWEEYGFSSDIEIEEVVDEIVALKKEVHRELIERMQLKKIDFLHIGIDKRRDVRKEVESLIGEILSEKTGGILEDRDFRSRLVKEIADEALGFGPLEDLIKDPDITDIMVNNKDQIYIEKFGRMYRVDDKKFISNEQVIQVIERIIAPLGRRIDESVPMVDARLPDGSRVNAIIPPLSLTGPMLTIRKFGKERYTAKNLIEFGSISEDMANFLKACIVSRKNMIISGGTGSGKTTVLNAFSQFIPNNERIITIEDAAELRLHQEHWARLESRPPNIEGKGEITIRDLFRNTLRMRPDRIIIGECRGVEALDMLQAMNTGHDGSLTTIHANSTHDVIARLDSMILMSGIELPIRAIREMIASAIDIIVHTARLSDGKRKVLCITELIGLEEDMMTIKMKDIFVFVQKGIDEKGNIIGEFTATGYIPSFYDEIVRRGIDLPREVFSPKPIFYEVNQKKG